MIRKDIIIVFMLVAIVALMIVPLNQTLIDMLLALNITFSVCLLLVAIYLKKPSDFSTFPSIILLGTAFRLALSVGTTRLILADADGGDIIEAFGDFLVDGSIAIGFVIFLVITVVQFLVVTKGAERVAEVGARFALDSMPGKQMSIDAEARSGDITAEQAKTARKNLDESSRFFGAMDGAMKFVKGDAIAGLIIICINLIGGIAVGVSVHGFSLGDAASTYSLLTVGDGLVAQIPAILMALCAGIIVTRVDRAEAEDNLGNEIFNDLGMDARVPMIASGIVFLVGFIPGFPTFIFAGFSVVLLIAASKLRKSVADKDRAAAESAEAEEADQNALPVSNRVKLLIGERLASTMDQDRVIETIKKDFGLFCDTIGVRFPRPDVAASDQIGPLECAVLLDSVPLFKCSIPEQHLFVEHATHVDDICNPEISLNTAVLSGAWVSTEYTAEITERQIGHQSVEEVLSDLVCRYYQHHIRELFTVQVYEGLHAALTKAEPEAMKRLDDDVDESAMYKIVKTLLEEGVPISPHGLFVNALHYWVTISNKPQSHTLVECVRGSMKRQLCNHIAQSQDMLGLAMVSPEIEVLARETIGKLDDASPSELIARTFLPRKEGQILAANLQPLLALQRSSGKHVALLISADLRRPLGNFLSQHNIHLPILSPHEVSQEIPCLPITLVTLTKTVALRFPEEGAEAGDIDYFDTFEIEQKTVAPEPRSARHKSEARSPKRRRTAPKPAETKLEEQKRF